MKKQTFDTFAKLIGLFLLIAISAFSAVSFFMPEIAEAFIAFLGNEGGVGTVVATTAIAVNTRATTDAARPRSASDPGHLAEDVSKFVTMIKPDDFALDTLLREVGQSEKATDLIVNFEEVVFRGHQDTMASTYTTDSEEFATITVTNPSLWLKTDTIYVPSILVSGRPLQLRIDSKNANGTLVVTSINSVGNIVPTLSSGAVIYRGANSEGEKAAKGQNLTLIPANRFNYCQRFTAQVDEGYIRSMLDTKTGFNYRDQNFIRMYDFRTSLAKAGYFGEKAITPSQADGESVYHTEGIYHQLTKQLDWTTAGGITNNMWIDWTNSLFADNSGSTDRFVFAGRNLIAAISKIPAVEKQLEAKSTEIVAGVKLSKVETLFGELYIKHDKVFDAMGHTDNGIVLDLAQIMKRPFMPLTSRQLKLREAGIENTNATFIEEIMCLETRYLQTHARIVRTS
jgi:hypothetical protein